MLRVVNSLFKNHIRFASMTAPQTDPDILYTGVSIFTGECIIYYLQFDLRNQIYIFILEFFFYITGFI